MTPLLRVYDPIDCDEHGVPLDMERCRECKGLGRLPIMFVDPDEDHPCPRCHGHGSLKTALRALLFFDQGGDVLRCDTCGHPEVDEGRACVWYPTGDGPWEQRMWTFYALGALRAGGEPNVCGFLDWAHERRLAAWGFSVYMSTCDEGCQHDGPGRVDLSDRRENESSWTPVDDLSLDYVGDTTTDETKQASWREIEVRALGWSHDLRPGRFVARCLRCWAATS